jgi:hypothetical protein
VSSEEAGNTKPVEHEARTGRWFLAGCSPGAKSWAEGYVLITFAKSSGKAMDCKAFRGAPVPFNRRSKGSV